MEQKELLLKVVTRVCIFSLLVSLIIGCGNQSLDNTGQNPEPNCFDVVTPAPFPEGVTLTGLYITHQGGMAAGPYYILSTTDGGTYMKISDLSPDDWRMTDGEDISEMPFNAQYLGFADTVKDCEHGSSVRIEDESPLRELEAAITEYGALAWDGYNESDTMEGVLDSGDSYRLYLELSDESTVTMKGYNVCPAGFMPLYMQVQQIFEANRD